MSDQERTYNRFKSYFIDESFTDEVVHTMDLLKLDRLDPSYCLRNHMYMRLKKIQQEREVNPTDVLSSIEHAIVWGDYTYAQSSDGFKKVFALPDDISIEFTFGSCIDLTTNQSVLLHAATQYFPKRISRFGREYAMDTQTLLLIKQPDTQWEICHQPFSSLALQPVAVKTRVYEGPFDKRVFAYNKKN